MSRKAVWVLAADSCESSSGCDGFEGLILLESLAVWATLWGFIGFRAQPEAVTNSKAALEGTSSLTLSMSQKTQCVSMGSKLALPFLIRLIPSASTEGRREGPVLSFDLTEGAL